MPSRTKYNAWFTAYAQWIMVGGAEEVGEKVEEALEAL